MTRVPDEIRPEPTSVKLIWYLLRQKDEATQRELRAASGLDRDTVAEALRRLRNHGYADPQGRPSTDLRTRRWQYRDG